MYITLYHKTLAMKCLYIVFTTFQVGLTSAEKSSEPEESRQLQVWYIYFCKLSNQWREQRGMFITITEFSHVTLLRYDSLSLSIVLRRWLRQDVEDATKKKLAYLILSMQVMEIAIRSENLSCCILFFFSYQFSHTRWNLLALLCC